MIATDLLSIGNTFWSGIANHLWQSTLFAIAAWLITLFMKKNRARSRYWIWFTVSIKFLIPFSLIVNLGGLIAPEWIKAPVEIPPELNAIHHTINQPFTLLEPAEASPASDAAEARPSSDKTPWIPISLWLCGAMAVLLNWYVQNTRMSGIVRKAELLKDAHTLKGFHRIKLENRIFHTVRLVSTRDAMEPGVFGIFRPVIMLPDGILNHINDSELETILLHEFAHIQYKDNLVAFIHMLVEAFFWFHPFVWMTGSRLISERELACDESVLRSGKNPQAYAEGILKVCEHYYMSPLPCVSGVIGSQLKTRISGIMKKQIGHELSPLKILFLSTAGLLVLCIPLTVGMINAPPSQAHPIADSPRESVSDTCKPDNVDASFKPEAGADSSEALDINAYRDIPSTAISGSMLQDGQEIRADKASGSEMAAEPVQSSTGTIPIEISPTEKKLSGKPLAINNSPVIATARAESQTAFASEKETESLKSAEAPGAGTEAKKSVLLAQKQAPMEASSGASIGDIDASDEEADTIPEKYDLDNELEAVDRVSTFRIRSYENIDRQSLILEANYNDYYLLVLRRPRFETTFGKTGIPHTGSAIIAGHDRVVMNYTTGPEYYFIDRIYKLEGREQVTEIKKRLRKE